MHSFYFIKNINISRDYLCYLFAVKYRGPHQMTGVITQVHKASFKGQHKAWEESTPGRVHTTQHWKLDFHRPLKEGLWGTESRSSVFANTDLFFYLENMDQNIWAGWTIIHLFPAPAVKWLSHSRTEIWSVTGVNYHTFINPLHVPSNPVIKGTVHSVLNIECWFHASLGPDTEAGWAGLSLTSTVFRVRDRPEE